MALASSGSVYVIATTMSLAGIMSCQIGNVLACRSNRNRFSIRPADKQVLLLGILAEIVIVLAVVYPPRLANVFHLMPPDNKHWLILAPFGLILLACEEGRKWFVRRQIRNHRGPPQIASQSDLRLYNRAV